MSISATMRITKPSGGALLENTTIRGLQARMTRKLQYDLTGCVRRGQFRTSWGFQGQYAGRNSGNLRESTKNIKTQESTSVTARSPVLRCRPPFVHVSPVVRASEVTTTDSPSVGSNKCTEQQKPNHVHCKPMKTVPRDAACPDDITATAQRPFLPRSKVRSRGVGMPPAMCCCCCCCCRHRIDRLQATQTPQQNKLSLF
jgi:hypothetical protein